MTSNNLRTHVRTTLLTTLVIGAIGTVALAFALNVLIAAATPTEIGRSDLGWGPFDLATVARIRIDDRTSSVSLSLGWSYWALVAMPFLAAAALGQRARARVGQGVVH